MPPIPINLSDDERRQAEIRAAELGHDSVEAYVAALVRADTELPLSDELEADLLRSLQSPGRELTPADWDEKRRRLMDRARQARAGSHVAPRHPPPG